ncbi:hypothetical protein, partial [Reyranella soli]|uniref:hypothetical protein n=1 Tax=Reyranella soli TaxID=1230389 RepID=UPI001C3FD01F
AIVPLVVLIVVMAMRDPYQSGRKYASTSEIDARAVFDSYGFRPLVDSGGDPPARQNASAGQILTPEADCVWLVSR